MALANMAVSYNPSYTELQSFLKRSRSGKLGHNTWAEQVSDTVIAIKYHRTYIAYHSENWVILNADGFESHATTKARLDFFSPASVYQENWIVYCGEKEYQSGIAIHRNGGSFVAIPNLQNLYMYEHKTAEKAAEVLEKLESWKPVDSTLIQGNYVNLFLDEYNRLQILLTGWGYDRLRGIIKENKGRVHDDYFKQIFDVSGGWSYVDDASTLGSLSNAPIIRNRNNGHAYYWPEYQVRFFVNNLFDNSELCFQPVFQEKES